MDWIGPGASPSDSIYSYRGSRGVGLAIPPNKINDLVPDSALPDSA